MEEVAVTLLVQAVVVAVVMAELELAECAVGSRVGFHRRGELGVPSEGSCASEQV